MSAGWVLLRLYELCSTFLLVSGVCAKSLPSRRTLCNPKDCSPLGSSVCGILQIRTLEYAAVSFSSGSSQPQRLVISLSRLLHWQAISLPLVPPGGQFLVAAVAHSIPLQARLFHLCHCLYIPPPFSSLQKDSVIEFRAQPNP